MVGITLSRFKTIMTIPNSTIHQVLILEDIRETNQDIDPSIDYLTN